jgi:peptidoglycan/LPS O-acetylase OafA/YrhL
LLRLAAWCRRSRSRLLLKRYLKLAVPYLASLLIGIGCATIARALMTHDSIPEWPTLSQFLAHALLLQSILGYDGLSTGVWYIAIDFQLFALLLATLWLARGIRPWPRSRHRRAAIVGLLLVATLALFSLYHFNRDAEWDNWACVFLRVLRARVADFLGGECEARRALAVA